MFLLLILYVLQKLNKEKAALQTTTELLTVRLNSLNEILALQEEKLVKKVSVEIEVFVYYGMELFLAKPLISCLNNKLLILFLK